MKLYLFEDLKESLKERQLWTTLAWIELKRGFSGTKLGVLWRPTSALIVGLSLGNVYSIILNKSTSDYIPYVVAGLVVWSLISQLITEGGKLFLANGPQIKEMPISYTSYIAKYLTRNIISFLLSSLAVILVLVYYNQLSRIEPIAFIFGTLMVVINGIWVSILFGIATIYIRDITELISNFMRLVFFITPVLWSPDMASSKGQIVKYNPLYYYLDVIRSPMIGHEVDIYSYYIIATITIVGLIVSVIVYSKYRDKISFMV
ncbi:ABC transporter permease [Vibrio cholerae]|uniref:ABC transporter permease n=1 Tax=Vibrio cholerae TaxID=666 RepID=UPI00165287E5|nr:ABC transporter permease [Vibrio cholerae]EKF6289094.1 ABC transporter permease [Vibrio cholerae]MCX9511651.1 ABC transporter permease [Vibrio cholerae]BCN20608.1 putative O-antigen ABC transporter permease [Vibrio cholerae]GIB58906.1 lipopolysaccharide/O-antigen transport protein [Vibrio cholerae]HAS3582869.1 ABC transporter permease [Vibrio cholerae]